MSLDAPLEFWGLFLHLPYWDLVTGFQRSGKCLFFLKSVQKFKRELTEPLPGSALRQNSGFEFVKLRAGIKPQPTLPAPVNKCEMIPSLSEDDGLSSSKARCKYKTITFEL